jgi:CheY-like chemotaxis protein
LAVNNGARTLEILNSLPAGKLPLLIIMDYNLPQLDGSHLLKALHLNKRFAAVPKIIWSTSTAGVFEKQCLELGANAYLVKPGTVQGFRDLIQHILRLCTTTRS